MSRMCMGCMAQLPEGENVCRYCGFVEGTGPKEGYHLAPETILTNRYVIGKVIGYGGFGVTYVAWDAVLEKKVAIKEYLPGDFATRRPGDTIVSIYEGEREEQYISGLKKFIEEAQRLAKFTEVDGVVHVYDSFSYNNTAYIVMEFLEGETLKEKLKRTPKLSYEEAKKIILPVLRALEEVHKTGIIHRDIAPDNIFLLSDGRVKLLDFGAARFATTTHSKSLSVILKPGYAPEEQYRSRGEQGPWTDVYASCATLYRMMTGLIPEDALERNAHDTLKDISSLAELPDNAANAIMNGLNIKACDRIQSAGILADALEDKMSVERNIIKQKKENTGKIPLWVKIAGPVAACIIVICGILYATGVFDRIVASTYIMSDRIPNVVGKLLDKVNRDLEASGATYKVIADGGDYDNNFDENIIMSQAIEAGRSIPEDFNVLNVKISKGKQLVYIEDLSGLSKENAEAALSDIGINVEFVEVEAKGLAEGTVVRIDTDLSQPIEYGSTIKVEIAKKADETNTKSKSTVPNIRNKSLAEATKLVADAGLALQVKTYIYSDTVSKDCVIDQTPVGGMETDGNTVIFVTISKGAENETMVQIPDVRYINESDAIAELNVKGLKVSRTERYDDNWAAGYVIEQSPINTLVKKGSTVKITVSKGQSAIKVPNVVNKSERAAKTALNDAGIINIDIVETYSDKINKGNIISQVPTAGSSVYPADRITLTVSLGEKPADIISVKGISISSDSETGKKNQTVNLSAGVSPSNATNKAVIWTSSDTTVAEVSSSGEVAFVGAGEATITVTAIDGGYSAKCNITVLAAVPNIDGDICNSAVAAVEQEGFKTSVKYIYSDEVANGYVISHEPSGYNKLGTKITITASKGVKPVPVTGISMPDSITVKKGDSTKLEYSISPSNATNSKCVWESSNSSVVSVSSTGVITAVKGGTATVSVTTDDGDYKAACKVTVLVAVPDISGKATESAKTAVENAGFKTNVSSEYSTDVKSGYVISYSPSGYNTVDTVVNIVSSKGVKPVNVTGVSIPSTLTIRKDSSSALSATISPSNATNKKCTWKSSNTSVATVSSNGTVKGVKGGTATITVTTDDGSYTSKCTVTVTVAVPDIKEMNYEDAIEAVNNAGFSSVTKSFEYSGNIKKDRVISYSPTGYTTVNKTIDIVISKGIRPVDVSGISIPSALTLKKGSSSTLTATFTPSDATNQKCSWKSSNTSVATVSSSGTVKGVGGGTATITVTSDDGGYTSKCTVTVTVPVPDVAGRAKNSAISTLENDGFDTSVSYNYSNDVENGYVISYSPTGYAKYGTNVDVVVSKGVKVTGISVSSSSLTLNEGATSQLTATVSPSNATNKDYTWSSSDSSVASVSSSGIVTAKSMGSATITAKTSDCGYTAKCTVTVRGSVPNVNGYYYTDAKSAIQNAGFTPKIVQVFSTSVSRGYVISYSPSGYIAAGTTIEIKVSKGTSGKYVESLNGYSSDEYNITTYYKYRSRTRSKEYTTSTSSSLSGWTRYDSKTVTNYRTVYNYYVYGFKPIDESDLTHRYSSDQPTILDIAHRWYTLEDGSYKYTTEQAKQFCYKLTTQLDSKMADGTRITRTVNYSRLDGKQSGAFYMENTGMYWDGTTSKVADGTTTTYYFYRWTSWGNWSGWSDYVTSVPSDTDTKQYDYTKYYYVEGRSL